jgi:hypothetical protein
VSSDERNDFLSRWSRRKAASKAGPAAAAATPAAGVVPAKAGTQSPAQAGTQSPVPAEQPKAPAPLPPVESLTLESDFTPFMRSGVDPLMRQQALRTLFRDPRFNIQDGLDVYIADFSQPDPIPPEWLGKLNQMARLGDYLPPKEEVEAGPDPAAEVELAEIPPPDQVIAPVDAKPESDTSDAGSQPPELKQS